MEKKLLVGITGASGAVYALFFLRKLREISIPCEVIITDAGKIVIKHELEMDWRALGEYAEKIYGERDIGAPPASGSAPYLGLVIIPCSMGTLAGIATGQARNLLLRAGDVTLKEKRPLVLVVREAPLNSIHLQNMLTIAQAGGVIFPAMPGFYNRPKTLEELVEHFVERLLQFMSQFIDVKGNWKAWEGLE